MFTVIISLNDYTDKVVGKYKTESAALEKVNLLLSGKSKTLVTIMMRKNNKFYAAFSAKEIKSHSKNQKK